MFSHDAEIILDLTNEEYHSSAAVSKSGLDLIDKGLFYYWDKHINPNKEEERRRDAFIIGEAVHTLVLEPELEEESIAVYPHGIRGDKRKAFEQENEGKLLLTASTYAKAQGMRDAVMRHPLASQYLTGPGRAEQSIFWTWGPNFPVRCRIRPDRITGDGVMVDLKTTKSVRPASFQKSIELFRYHVQAGFYSEGFYRAFGYAPKAFVFVAVEKIPPYHVGVFVMKEKAIKLGRQQAALDVMKYYRAYTTGQWGIAEPEEVDVSDWQERLYEQKREEFLESFHIT